MAESEFESEAKAESELQSEALAESEPEIDSWSVSTFGPDSDLDPEYTGHRSELESEFDLELESEDESENGDDVQWSDLCSMHDNNPLPIAFGNKHFLYKNPAMVALEKAYDEHLEEARKLNIGYWDAVAPPHNLRCVGGVRPYDITDENRPRFIRYCNLSLNKYNADNQGANFVFYELVKATSLVACPLYYITFMAKDASNNNNNTDALTFQAKVYDKVETDIILCMVKPN